MARNKGRNINVLMILITAISAAVTWFLIYGLKEMLIKFGGPVAIGTLSAIFLAVMSIVVMLGSRMLGSYRADVVTGERKKSRFMVTMLISITACFGLMVGFEWWYELGVKGESDGIDTYIFVVDDSGSTADTDPNQMRYKAIQEIMKEKNGVVQYAIYAFADEVTVLQPIQNVSKGIPLVEGNSCGGTGIKTALERVISDYEKEKWNADGDACVILITDGYATDMILDFEIDSVLRRFSKNDIPVSSVGLGNVDESLLNRIANKTKGQFVDISEVDQLDTAVKTVASISGEKQDLFSKRVAKTGNTYHGIMRVVFVTIFGLMIAIAEAFAYGSSDSFWRIILIGAVKGMVAAIFLELGISTIGLPARFVSLSSMTIMGVVVATFDTLDNCRRSSGGTSQRIDFDD